MTIQATLLAHSLARELRVLGIDASVAVPEGGEALLRAVLRRERAAVRLRGRHVSTIVVRLGGFLSLHPENWGRSLRVGGVPLAERRVTPVQFHHLVAKDVRLDPGAYRATLKVEAAGFFDRRVAGFSWQGAWLANRLQADEAVRTALGESLTTHLRLHVEADASFECVRIVQGARLVLGFSLLEGGQLEIEDGLPTRRLLDAIEGIAQAVRDG